MSLRMAKVFGKREIELVAIELLDKQLLHCEFTMADVMRGTDPNTGVYRLEGFRLAVEWKWILRTTGDRHRASGVFIERTEAAAERDRAEGKS